MKKLTYILITFKILKYILFKIKIFIIINIKIFEKMNRLASMSSMSSESGLKYRFFEAVKNENKQEVEYYFRNERLRVWEFKEEDDYTGI
jgi:hypothetical protein